MKRIAVISSSVRDGRLSHRAALFVCDYLRRRGGVEVDLIDLLEYDFPVFHERLEFQKNPSEAVLDFTKRFKAADGLLIVSPVYNSDYPAALKNFIDLYEKEWRRKPAGIVSVTSGTIPPLATIQKIQTLLLKLGALIAPVLCMYTKAEESFSAEGVPALPEKAESPLKALVDELVWLMEKTAD